MRAYRRNDRVGCLGGRNRCPVGIRAVQHETLDALGERRGERDGRAAAAGAADERHALELQLVDKRAQRRNFPLEGQIRLSHGAVRHADAEPVIPDQCVAVCHALPKSPIALALPVELEMADPPRWNHERWSGATFFVCDVTDAERQEPDL